MTLIEPRPSSPRALDFGPTSAEMLADVVAGLSSTPKTLLPKYFYDERGSKLFERITGLDEYYPTRTEIGILRESAGAIAGKIGSDALLMEYGSGSSTKTPILLEALHDPVAYVPIDISCDHLEEAAAETRRRFPELDVHPVCADYTSDYEIPRTERSPRRRVAFFPGSTIGNLRPHDAEGFLRHVAEICGAAGGLLIGVDLVKDPDVLECAYDDEEGVTAEFNLNLLRRLNRELGADFELDRFRHRAFWNADDSRIEMHLVSECVQTVRVGGRSFDFSSGETIHTENSYKYTLEAFRRLAAAAGFDVEAVWTDDRRWFSVQMLVVRDDAA